MISPTTLRPHHRWHLYFSLIAMAVAVSLLPGHSYAAGRHTTTGWTASVALFTISHGRWRATTSVDSLGELRAVLTVRGQGLGASGVTATMQLKHLSWQGFKKVIMPPNVTAQMTRTRLSGDTATFATQVTIPTLLPVYWSVVHIDIRDGRTHAAATSGVMVGGPAKRTPFNTLTVPQARTFCSLRPPLPYLRYAVFIHGYFVGLQTGGDGPPAGIVLDRPRHVTSAVLPNGNYTHGIRTNGFGLPKPGWGTAAGFLACGNGKPLGFAGDR